MRDKESGGIVVFIPTLGGGGISRAMIRIAEWFALDGWRVDLVVMSSGKGILRSELPPTVRFIDLGSLRIAKSLLSFVAFVRARRPDLVISADGVPNAISAWSRILSRSAFKVVMTEHSVKNLIHGKVATLRGVILRLLLTYAYRRADAIVAVSEGIAASLKRLMGRTRVPVQRIYNPVWSPELEASASQSVVHPWLGEEASRIILSAGRLEREKDFATLLNAFATVRSRRSARLILLGEGSLRVALEELAQQLDIAEDIWMPGFVANPFAYMARSRVFALSSVHEGLPTVLIEAMACGTPVVSTDCPSGPSEILDGGRYGPLVPVGDAEALAAAIEQQLERPTPAELLRARAREFSVEASADAYLKLVEDLLARRR